MAIVSYVEPRQASAEIKQMYEEKLKGKPNNLQRALAHRPEVLTKFIEFYGSVGKALDKRLYELVYIRVAMINNCEY